MHYLNGSPMFSRLWFSISWWLNVWIGENVPDWGPIHLGKKIILKIILKIITKIITYSLSKSYNKKSRKSSLYISPFQIGLSCGFSCHFSCHFLGHENPTPGSLTWQRCQETQDVGPTPNCKKHRSGGDLLHSYSPNKELSINHSPVRLSSSPVCVRVRSVRQRAGLLKE